MRQGPAKMAKNRLKKLNRRHIAFVEHTIKGATGADACRIAGFTSKNPSETANRLLKDELIIRALEEKDEEIRNNTQADEQEIALRLTRIARGTEEATSTTVRALELMAKIKGMMIDRVETKDTTSLVDEVISGSRGGGKPGGADVTRIA